MAECLDECTLRSFGGIVVPEHKVGCPNEGKQYVPRGEGPNIVYLYSRPEPEISYDEWAGFVVIAPDEQSALALILKHRKYGDEGEGIWKQMKPFTIGWTNRPPQIVLGRFCAG